MMATNDRFVSRTVAYESARGTFVCRVVLMPPIGDDAVVAAVLDTATLRVRLLEEDQDIDAPDDVTDLSTQSEGRWLLRTLTSEHVIDLTAGSWERIRGANGPRIAAPSRGRLRSFSGAAVGERMHITTSRPIR